MNIKQLNEKLEKFLLKEDLYAIADPEDEDSWKSMGSGDQQGPIFGSKSAASKYKKEHGLKGKIYDVDFGFLIDDIADFSYEVEEDTGIAQKDFLLPKNKQKIYNAYKKYLHRQDSMYNLDTIKKDDFWWCVDQAIGYDDEDDE